MGVRKDVVGIEDFYILISGQSVELNRFLDLSGMAAEVGYNLRARNITALGVQVVGTIFNKMYPLEMISGDYLGLRASS